MASREDFFASCKRTLWPLALLCLSGCEATLMRSLQLPQAFAPVQVQKNVTFDAQHGLRADVYMPKPQTQRAAMLVFLHGGSWRNGDKSWYGFVGKHYAKQGFVVLVPNYRKVQQARFPAFMHDAASAFAFAHQNAERYGADKARLFVFGHSAGAHIGALLVTDARYLAQHQLGKSDIAGFVGLSGAYDFLPLTAASVIQAFNGDAMSYDSQPIHFVDGREAPMLLMHGDKDRWVWAKNSRNFAAKVQALGGRAELHILPNTGHFSPIFQSVRGMRALSPSVDPAILQFIQTSKPAAALSRAAVTD
jgi:acetyl esterase/lipase